MEGSHIPRRRRRRSMSLFSEFPVISEVPLPLVYTELTPVRQTGQWPATPTVRHRVVGGSQYRGVGLMPRRFEIVG